MQTNNADVMLLAIVPDSLKDDVVDTLMEMSVTTGFNMFKINGFSKEHSQYNVSEQVLGYRGFYKFEVVHQAGDTPNLLDQLRNLSAQESIRYWVLPIQQSGIL